MQSLKGKLRQQLPLISVLIPVYNCAEYVVQAITSITGQTYKNLEILICDDASTDESLQKVMGVADNRITVLRNTENLGYLRTCNFLMSKARGDFLCFQDADDWSNSHRLELQLQEFNKDQDLGLCGTFAHYHRESDSPLMRSYEISHEEIIHKSQSDNEFCNASIMISREVFTQVGGYKEYFDRFGNEDYDWNLRISENFKVKNLPKPLYNVRIRFGSISRQVRSVDNLISKELVHFLSSQRRQHGSDSLSGLEIEHLMEFHKKLLEPFQVDKSLRYRKSADVYFFQKNFSFAYRSSIEAVKLEPLKIINIKYLLKTLFFYILAKIR